MALTPLPDAQLDRFAMKLRIGYPAKEDEADMLAAAVEGPRDWGMEIGPKIEPSELQSLQERVAKVSVGLLVRHYLVELAHATRSHRQVILGLSSPRAVDLATAVPGSRLSSRRNYVTPDDVQDMATPVLEVRLGVGPKPCLRCWTRFSPPWRFPAFDEVNTNRCIMIFRLPFSSWATLRCPTLAVHVAFSHVLADSAQSIVRKHGDPRDATSC